MDTSTPEDSEWPQFSWECIGTSSVIIGSDTYTLKETDNEITLTYKNIPYYKLKGGSIIENTTISQDIEFTVLDFPEIDIYAVSYFICYKNGSLKIYPIWFNLVDLPGYSPQWMGNGQTIGLSLQQGDFDARNSTFNEMKEHEWRSITTPSNIAGSIIIGVITANQYTSNDYTVTSLYDKYQKIPNSVDFLNLSYSVWQHNQMLNSVNQLIGQKNYKTYIQGSSSPSIYVMYGDSEYLITTSANAGSTLKISVNLSDVRITTNYSQSIDIVWYAYECEVNEQPYIVYCNSSIYGQTQFCNSFMYMLFSTIPEQEYPGVNDLFGYKSSSDSSGYYFPISDTNINSPMYINLTRVQDQDITKNYTYDTYTLKAGNYEYVNISSDIIMDPYKSATYINYDSLYIHNSTSRGYTTDFIPYDILQDVGGTYGFDNTTRLGQFYNNFCRGSVSSIYLIGTLADGYLTRIKSSINVDRMLLYNYIERKIKQ